MISKIHIHVSQLLLHQTYYWLPASRTAKPVPWPQGAAVAEIQTLASKFVAAALAAETEIVAVAVEALITQAEVVATPTPEPSQVQQRPWPANVTAPGAIGCHPDNQGGTGRKHNKLVCATESARIW